jgi:methionyl-tRNA formyltransferase
MRIVFFGTPDFAVESLRFLCTMHQIMAVVTAPDKAGGRGHQLIESPVKKWALDNNIRVLQPKNLKGEVFKNKLQSLNADLFVTVAFRMLPKSIWSLPHLGTINLHGSLLPKYRGAAPIQRAILCGENETGLTTFLISENIDTGSILMQVRTPIGPDECFGELYERLKKLGGPLLLKTMEGLEKGTLHASPQDENQATYAPKINADDLVLDWGKDSQEVNNQIRAFSPQPGAFTVYEGIKYKILRAIPHTSQPKYPPGTWNFEDPKSLKIHTLNGHLEIMEIQPESKRRMSIADFLNGYQRKMSS